MTEVILHPRYEGLVASLLGQDKRFLIILSRFVDAAEGRLCGAAIVVRCGVSGSEAHCLAEVFNRPRIVA